LQKDLLERACTMQVKPRYELRMQRSGSRPSFETPRQGVRLLRIRTEGTAFTVIASEAKQSSFPRPKAGLFRRKSLAITV